MSEANHQEAQSGESKRNGGMSWNRLLASATDPYERKARLYPAILALLPLFGIGVFLYGVGRDLAQSMIAAATTLGGAYLLVNIGRELGKRLETDLFTQWGGAPTTQLQRHRDSRIDPITKQARQVFLAGKLGKPAPTAAQENADPMTADQFYAAGTRWLLDLTRDRRRFSLLFEENVSYGYRRNALGLKPVGICVGVLSIGWVLGSQGIVTSHGLAKAALLQMTNGAQLSMAVSIATLAIWILFFIRQTVKTSAFVYADMLLRACSILG